MENVVFKVVKPSAFDRLVGKIRMYIYERRTRRQRAAFRAAMDQVLEERRIFIKV